MSSFVPQKGQITFQFGETDGVIDIGEYPFKASWYIWTWPKDLDFNKAISELIGQEVKLINRSGGNGHESGTFITKEDFERDYCKHGHLKTEDCISCEEEVEEAGLLIEDLKACPFCGMCNRLRADKNIPLRQDVHSRPSLDGDGTLRYYIECMCGTRGPDYAKSEKAAMRLWNGRRESMFEKFEKIKNAKQ